MNVLLVGEDYCTPRYLFAHFESVGSDIEGISEPIPLLLTGLVFDMVANMAGIKLSRC